MIREANDADIAILSRLMTAIRGVPVDAGEECRRPKTSVLVAAPDGVPTGYLVQQVVADVAEIQDIGVAPAFRRRGIARALVMAAMERARAARCREVQLEVASDNVHAQSLYRGVGFACDGVRRRYYPSGADALLMSVRIAPQTPR